MRQLRYAYLENRWKINLAVILLVAIIGVSIKGYFDSRKKYYYSLGNELISNNCTVVVTNVYLTKLDYKGNKINNSDNFVILKLKLKKNIDQEYSFDSSNISIIINGKQYKTNQNYFESFSDFGIAYKEQKLTKEYEDYYLTYKVPYEFSTKDIYIKVVSNFDYSINGYVYNEIKASYETIDDKTNEKVYSIGDEMNIDVYGVKYKVIVNSFDIKNKYKLTSNAVVNEKNYSLVEYLTPTAEDNEEKAIMRLNYNESFSGNNGINLATIFSKYAIIEYEIDNNKKEGKIYSFISPKLSKEQNVKYIQVSKDVLNGKNRTIKIKLRDQIFKYELD